MLAFALTTWPTEGVSEGCWTWFIAVSQLLFSDFITFSTFQYSWPQCGCIMMTELIIAQR